MGVEAILLRYLVVISGVALFAENFRQQTNADGLSVRQGYDKNLIGFLSVKVSEICG